MHLRRIIRAQKTAIKIGPWRSGKVPKADFPIARKAYGLGNSYEWCVVTFQALGGHFRVLVVLNEPKEKYEAILGLMASGMLRLLCSYQWHADEPGWHCHATCDDPATVPRGIMRGPWIRRIPKARRLHRHQQFNVTKASAVQLAIDRYKIEEKGPLL
jgi:hypothetical protein